jgi:hypothetical protein
MVASLGPCRLALLAALAASLSRPTPASAEDCSFVYDEGFRASFKRMSGMTLPHKAGHVPSMAECQAALQAMFNDPQYRNDVGLGRTSCECEGGDDERAPQQFTPQGGSLQQQLASKLVSSLLNQLFSGLDAPPGPDGEAIRQKLQKQWDDEEAARKVAEQRRDEEAFKKAHQVATSLLGSRPAGAGGAKAEPAHGAAVVYLGMGTVPSLLRASGAVTEAEWAEARAWQARIDALRSKAPLTAAEAQELAALEARRNARWSRAVAVPGLTQRDRDGLRLKLHVTGGGAVASVEDLLQLRQQAASGPAKAPVHPLTTLTEASATFGVQTALEAAGEAGADHLTDALEGKARKLVKYGDA